jgi:DNA-binding PadR family transcriptional regulator
MARSRASQGRPRSAARNPLQPSRITEKEGSLLSLVLRRQPVTAYQLFKAYESSPVTSFNNSKGGVYPAIRRLRDRGLIVSEAVEGDARGTEALRCTDLGARAVDAWINAIADDQIVLDDPLRTRLLSLERLTRDQKLEWIDRALGLLAAKKQTVDRFNASITVPYQRFAYQGTIAAIEAKLNWLTELRRHISDEQA